ncbi:methyltransferase domain-containing protein [Lysobacter sp. K5869]|uniref:methyltransferase domain-containing protein n=1 Tax=Lysobacter sp. K5869 TaxID=2820808 RepID=UPI001C05F659|nr:methyltransferase domain-containing protein [Lysobacter sp. K5869]QWP78541.1 methyltransferase domain-containing protein [Lysobacter sp. K5869]
MNQPLDPMNVDGVMQAVSARLRDSIPIESDAAGGGADGAVERMRAQLDRAFSRSGGGENGELQHWRSVTHSIPIKREYVLSELLGPADASFVEMAYRVVLRRDPDPEGYDFFLHELRSGHTTKVEVLGALRWSAEGMAKQVHIDGLMLPYKLQQWKRKPLFGRALSWLHGLARLGSLFDRQYTMEATQAREAHELGRHVNLLMDELSQMRGQQAGLLRNVARMMPMFERMHAADLERERFQPTMDKLYADFEDEFRGSRELVRARIEPYLDWIREAGAGSADAPVIDIGCGRGEWLELLGEHGLVASGIDLNRDFVDNCAGTGLKVVEGDAVDVLREVPEGSVGAITSMHLVEHLPFERVVSLIDAALRALRPGGLLLLETPNPENLLVGSHYFYMDPTHLNPLPPAMLRWVVENRGFADSRIERLSAHRPVNAPPMLPPEVAGSKSINDMLWHLHIAPDYAIVARRP